MYLSVPNLSRAIRRVLKEPSYKYEAVPIPLRQAKPTNVRAAPRRWVLKHLTRLEREAKIKALVKNPPSPSSLTKAQIAEMVGVLVGTEPFEPNLDLLDLDASVCDDSTIIPWYEGNDIPTHQIKVPPASLRTEWKKKHEQGLATKE